ncbi:unnamed protein product, partial [Amoebophrya sp. A120]
GREKIRVGNLIGMRGSGPFSSLLYYVSAWLKMGKRPVPARRRPIRSRDRNFP